MMSSKSKKRNGIIIAAIVVVVIVVVASFAMMELYKKPSSSSSTSYNATPSAVEQASTTTGANYSIQINAGLAFSSANVNFGDGNITHISGNGADSFTAYHSYTSPGTSLIYFNITAENGAVYSSYKTLIPVLVTPSSTYITDDQSLGTVTVNYTASSTSLNANYPIFSVGSTVYFSLGYYGEPVNSNYQIIGQSYTSNFGASSNITYSWDSSQGMFTTSANQLGFSNAFSSPGIYYVALTTTTATVNTTTGAIVSGSETSSSAFLDIAVFNGGAIAQAPNSIFVNDENYIGTPNTFDGAIAYDGQALEILFNTQQFLVGYQGNSTTQFFPELATNLPSVANGEINDNYANYTVQTPWGTNYTEHIQPYENYTFIIRSNATWQDGTPVTATDVRYSMIRTLLFDAGSPGTPGWIQAEFLLPGNFYESTSFFNLTQNITINPSQNSVTFHFQTPMTPSLVFQILAYCSGAIIQDSSWISAHGGNITWNAAGFEAYKAQGSAGDYNTYFETHIMSDGPYELDYIVPQASVVLVANPSFTTTSNTWFPVPTIKEVVINYIPQASTRNFALSSGSADAVQMASTQWSLVQSLESAGKVNVLGYPTMDDYFYMFNANINESLLSGIYPSANMPSNFFASLAVRETFSYAFNYNLYYAQQVGNAIYNTTFDFPYAGQLIIGLPGYQSVAQLNATTTGVPYFNMTIAKQWWDSVNLSALGITQSSSGVYEYNGAPLVIPFMPPADSPVDQALTTTWGTDLAQIITGASFPIVPETFTTLLANDIPGQNGQTIWAWWWGPDFPYPTDYMSAMADPANSSFFNAANGFLPYLFEQMGFSGQAANLTAMAEEYANASTSTNLTYAIQQFQMQNEMFVNMSIEVFLGQINFYDVMSKNVDVTQVLNFEENPVIAGEAALMYNYLEIT